MFNQVYSSGCFYRKLAKIMQALFALIFLLSLIGLQTSQPVAAEPVTPDISVSAQSGSPIYAVNMETFLDGEKLGSGASMIDHRNLDLIVSGAGKEQRTLGGLNSIEVYDMAMVQHLLTVNKSGEGTVTSTPDGINCGETCSAQYNENTVVTLTALPKTGWEFYGWIGACIGATCQVAMDGPKSVMAIFVFNQAPLDVNREGQGTVTSDPDGIDCGETCGALFDIDTVVTLTATPAPGWRFLNWSGDCTGTICEVTMDQRRNVLATFILEFEDVPDGYWAEDEIYRLFASGITIGCSQDPALYCPENDGTRAEIAVFLERVLNEPGYQPPPGTGALFADVPITHWAVNWIEQLYNHGITVGCDTDPLRYCPNHSVTRAEMAVFLLRTLYGADHVPPTVTETGFEDVPITHWAASWIAQLAAEGITTGVTPTEFDPEGFVTRAQMAVFLVRTFQLP